MKKILLTVFIASALYACNGSGSSTPAVTSDSTQVADTTAVPAVDTTATPVEQVK